MVHEKMQARFHVAVATNVALTILQVAVIRMADAIQD